MQARLFSYLAVVVIAGSAAGPGSAAEAVKPRYTLDASRDGFVRLDTVSGAVTHCHVAGGKWTCDAILDGDGGLAARIDALALDVARQAAATAALDARVTKLGIAGAATQVVSAPVGSVPVGVPTLTPRAAQSAQATFAARIVGRLQTMVRLLKHGRGAAGAAATRS